MLTTAEDALNAEFGPLAEGARWLVIDSAWLLIAPAALQEKDVTRADAENVIRDALRTVDFVTDVYTRTDLENGIAPGKYGSGSFAEFQSSAEWRCILSCEAALDRASRHRHHSRLALQL